MARKMDRNGSAVFSTTDEAVDRINSLQKISGGFGVALGFAHDWATRENTWRSYELFARYVIPRVNKMIDPVQRSADFVAERKAILMEGAGQAILAAIRAHNATHPREQSSEAAASERSSFG